MGPIGIRRLVNIYVLIAVQNLKLLSYKINYYVRFVMKQKKYLEQEIERDDLKTEINMWLTVALILFILIVSVLFILLKIFKEMI